MQIVKLSKLSFMNNAQKDAAIFPQLFSKFYVYQLGKFKWAFGYNTICLITFTRRLVFVLHAMWLNGETQKSS